MTSTYFRRRPFGRASSPPTWACYEQILHADDSASESCSEDDDDYNLIDEAEQHHDLPSSASSSSDEEPKDAMQPDEGKDGGVDVKGKGKETQMQPTPEERRRRRREERERRRKERPVMLRPILTIQRSGGFVWNQDLFVPAYCKDRCESSRLASIRAPHADLTGADIASTSPPTSHSPFSSEYDTVEVVEIRIEEGERVL